MTGLSLKVIAKAVNGKLYCDKTMENVCIKGVTMDSRLVEEGYLFVSIKGEKVDGHSFIDDVYKKGALCVFSEKLLEGNKMPYILVESSTDALRALAAYYRSTLNVKIIGISGSVGKTSTKEFIASVLETKYRVLKTAGNYNNEIGLPLTILKIRHEHEIAVLEMGISDFGEMDVLSKIARPDVIVLTNIGPCHLEALGDLDGVLKAKCEIFNYINKDAFIVLNGDDEKLKTITEVDGIKPVFYGKGRNNQYVAENIVNNGIEGTKFTLCKSSERVNLSIPIPGEHMVLNALAAYAIGEHFGLEKEDIRTGLENIKPVGGRVNIIKKNGFVVIDDCYNANPVSMKASLDVLTNANGRKVAIVGDMFELGTEENEMHYDVGVYAGNKNFDVIITIGRLSKNTFSGIMASNYKNNVFYFETVEEFLNNKDNILLKNDNILLKASHSMNFEKILKELTE